MKNQYLPYRLGIDLGTNSIGFALIELKKNTKGDDAPHDVIHMGVRIFSDGRDSKTGTSLAVNRRTARGIRRRRDRLVRRQEKLIDKLVTSGLMPQDKDERKKLELINPYLLRKKGLDEKLTPHEVGRAIFHINQRRGFQSNRKHIVKDEDAGKINTAIQKLTDLISTSGYRTIGEFLYHNYIERKPVRVRAGTVESQKKNSESLDAGDTKNKEAKTVYDFYPQRQMLKDEFDMLLKKQAEYHPGLFSENLMKELRNIVFYQRNLCPVPKGKCTLLKEESRAYSALPSCQYFRLLKEINNLKIVDRTIRRNRDDLSEEQRQKAIKYLSKHASVKFSSLAKKLGLTESETFNLATDVREEIYGLDTATILSDKKRFGTLWPSDLNKQDAIVSKLLEEDEDQNEAWLQQGYPDLTSEQRDAIIRASMKLEDGTLRYSTAAIEQLIPHLESKDQETGQYKNEYQAVTACGWQYANHYTGEIMMSELPYYGQLLEYKTQPVKYGSAAEKEYGRIANPTVHVALNQLRRVINAIIKEYGHPKEIAVEFSRDLKLTEKEKKKRNSENKKNKIANDRYNEAAEEKGFKPSSDTWLRQKLWEQQDGCCAYSLKKLELSEVLSNETEIDHILPRETLDDSNGNKVLVLRKLNSFKLKRTPYQAFKQDCHPNVDYEKMLLAAEKHIPSKKWRFLENAMERFEEKRDSGDEGWLARQLTDTSYIARVAREYLRYVVGDRQKGYPAVDTYPGGMTAKLRRGWDNWNTLLPIPPDATKEKNRDDHRHHAIDALVIACANRTLLQEISRASATGSELQEAWYKNLLHKAPPYHNYNRSKLQEIVDNITISHKPDHGTPGKNGGTSGQLHEETFYGYVQDIPQDKKNRIELVVTIPFNSIKEKDIEDIRDQHIKIKLHQHLNNRDHNQTFEESITEFSNKYNIRRIRVLVKKSKKVMVAVRNKVGNPYRYMATGSNHHIDIFCPIRDKKELKIKAGKWYAESVSTFDANQKNFEPKWRKEHPSAKLIMRLHINDMVAYDEKGQHEIRRVKKIDGTTERAYLVSHKVAYEQADKLSWAASASLLQEKNARKIIITPSGKIYDPGQASMPKPFRKIAETIE